MVTAYTNILFSLHQLDLILTSFCVCARACVRKDGKFQLAAKLWVADAAKPLTKKSAQAPTTKKKGGGGVKRRETAGQWRRKKMEGRN